MTTQQPKRPVGRPKGSGIRVSKTITHTIGQWAWNSNVLHSKIKRNPGDACWEWLGARGPQTNLFGAVKNGRAQMVQVNRLLHMERVGQPIDNIAVRMRCGNRYCCNPAHFNTSMPNNRRVNYQPVDLFRLTISEHRFSSLKQEQVEEIKTIARNYSHNSGIDWEWENRWMILSASDLLIAQLKHPAIVKLFTVQKVGA